MFVENNSILRIPRKAPGERNPHGTHRARSDCRSVLSQTFVVVANSWCRFFCHTKQPLPSKNLRDVASEWDVTFVQLPLEELAALAKAANFMNIPPLTKLLCSQVAVKYIMGKDPYQIIKEYDLFGYSTRPEPEPVENTWVEPGF